MNQVAIIGSVLAPWRAIAASRIIEGRFMAPLWRDLEAIRRRDLIAARRVQVMLAEMPSLRELRDLVAALLAASPDYDVASLLVAATVDGFPNARLPNPGTYLATVAIDLCDAGYGPEVVARGLQLARKATRFVPTVAEILDGCDKAKRDAELVLRVIAMLEEAANRARAICLDDN